MHGETEHTVNIIKTLGLEETQEVEACACSLVLVEACLIGHELTLKLGRAIIQFLRLVQHFQGRRTLRRECSRLALSQILARVLIL